MAKMKIFLDPSALRQAERMLDQIDAIARGPQLTKVLRSVGEQIRRDVKAVLPKPGYPGDKPELKPLRDTIAVKVENYRGGMTKVLVVGYGWPAGAHGQPLEAGHEKWLWGEHIADSPVDPYPYFREVVQLTQVTQSQRLIDQARKELAKAKGTG